MSSFNLHKLNQKWLSTLRQTQAEELQVDFAILRQTFESVVDCKDRAIDLLVCELSKREQESSSHLWCVDRLLEIQKSRLAALGSHWNTSLKDLSTEHGTERERLLKLHQRETEYLKTETFALGQIYAEIYREARLKYQRARDEIKNRLALESIAEDLQQLNLEELQKYKEDFEQRERALHLDSAVQDANQKQSDTQRLQDNISTMLSHLTSSQTQDEPPAHHLQTECEEMIEKVQQLRAYIEQQKRYTNAIEEQKEKALSLDGAIQEINKKRGHMQKLQDNISAAHSHLSSNHTQDDASARLLQAECEEMTQKIRQLRAKLCSDQAAERTRLVNHTKHSYNALQKVQVILEKGEMLLRHAEVCHKLETEQEKVLPFQASSLVVRSQGRAHAREEAMPEDLAKTSGDLGKFWQRYNKIRLERFCLEQEKKVLEKENQQLRIQLTQAIQKISINV